MPDLEVEAKQRLREAEVEVNLCNASKDVMLSHAGSKQRCIRSETKVFRNYFGVSFSVCSDLWCQLDAT